MALTPIGPTPSRGSAPDAFAVQADNLLAVQLPRLVTEINAVLPSIDAAVAAGPTATNAAAAASASANFKGDWATLSGALNIPASVSYGGVVWMLVSNTTNVALITPGVSAQWLKLGSNATLYQLAYASRATLRTLDNPAFTQAIVTDLGLFVWTSGSTERDDDETCFATTSGRWVMSAADPEWVQLMANGEAEEVYALHEPRIATLEAKFLRATFAMALTSVAASTNATAGTVGVVGAAVGDSVLISPPYGVGTAATDISALFIKAFVSAANTVTVLLCNPTAGIVGLTAATWTVLVIKQ